jgi:hypothetical protein
MSRLSRKVIADIRQGAKNGGWLGPEHTLQLLDHLDQVQQQADMLEVSCEHEMEDGECIHCGAEADD